MWKWKIVNNNSNSNCSVGNEFNYKTKALKSSLRDYNDV